MAEHPLVERVAPGKIALQQGILNRPRWPFFRKYLGVHVANRFGSAAAWAIDGADMAGRALYHAGAAFGMLVALLILLPLCIPGALFLTVQFCVRYVRLYRAAALLRDVEGK